MMFVVVVLYDIKYHDVCGGCAVCAVNDHDAYDVIIAVFY